MGSVDWAAVKQAAKAGGGIPEGEYNLVLDDVKGHVSGSGAEGLKFRFKVEDGAYKGATVGHTPTIQLEYPGLVKQFMDDLEVVGIGNGVLGHQEMDEIAAMISAQPRRVRANVEAREWQGRTTNRVKGGLLSAAGTANGAFSIAPPPVAAPAPFIAAPVDTPPPPF